MNFSNKGALHCIHVELNEYSTMHNLVALQGVHCSPSKNLELGIMLWLRLSWIVTVGLLRCIEWPGDYCECLLKFKLYSSLGLSWLNPCARGWYLTWKHWRDLTSCQNSLRRGYPPPCPPKGGWGRFLRSHHWSNWMALGHWSWLDESESWMWSNTVIGYAPWQASACQYGLVVKVFAWP